MYNPFTDHINQVRNNSTVTNQPNGSNDNAFMRNEKITIVYVFSRPTLARLSFADTYSLSCTNKKQFPTNIILNSTANPSQTMYQTHTAPDIGTSAGLFSSSSVPTVNSNQHSTPCYTKLDCTFRCNKKIWKNF